MKRDIWLTEANSLLSKTLSAARDVSKSQLKRDPASAVHRKKVHRLRNLKDRMKTHLQIVPE